MDEHPTLAALDKLKTRIQALRAKTIDNGCTEDEALSAAAKVAELLDRYDLSLLEEADAATMRLIDLFKRKPAWRQLVEADGKGRYRLNSDLLSPERQRVRFYRSGPAMTRAVGAEILSR